MFQTTKSSNVHFEVKLEYGTKSHSEVILGYGMIERGTHIPRLYPNMWWECGGMMVVQEQGTKADKSNKTNLESHVKKKYGVDFSNSGVSYKLQITNKYALIVIKSDYSN